MASKIKSDIEKFLEKNRRLLKEPSAVDEFVQLLKQENMRQVTDRLAAEFIPLKNLLTTVKTQQIAIISMLKRKLDLDAQEKKVLDMLQKALEALE